MASGQGAFCDDVVGQAVQARCFAQIVTTEERDVLRDVNVEVVLCVDEFRSAVMARNAICPGFFLLLSRHFTVISSRDLHDIMTANTSLVVLLY